MYNSEQAHCPHCAQTKYVEIEIYNDCGELRWDYQRVHRCAECKKMFKLQVEVNVEVGAVKEVTDAELEEYELYSDDENEDEDQ